MPPSERRSGEVPLRQRYDTRPRDMDKLRLGNVKRNPDWRRAQHPSPGHGRPGKEHKESSSRACNVSMCVCHYHALALTQPSECTTRAPVTATCRPDRTSRRPAKCTECSSATRAHAAIRAVKGVKRLEAAASALALRARRPPPVHPVKRRRARVNQELTRRAGRQLSS